MPADTRARMGVLGSLWRDLPVGRKIVAPYLVLTLLVGALVSAVATQQLAGEGAHQLSLLALHEQDNLNTVFNAVEERQLSELRLLSAADGVEPAIATGNPAGLRARLLPLIVDQLPDQVEVAVGNAQGHQLLSLRADPQQPGGCICEAGTGPMAYHRAAAAQALVVPVIVGVCLAALLLTVMVGSLVTRAITSPLREVLKATAEVGEGHLEHRATVRSGDEIGRLTASFNAMTELLQERTSRLERLSDDALLSLSATIDARDRYTHRHSIRVAAYSHVLGRAAGLSRAELDVIRRGCLVHDIGKIGVPDRVLAKPGPLDPDELAEMRRHPVP